mgnify:CR=1 FL=1
MPAASTRFLLRDGDVSLPREGSQLLDERRMHAAARGGATACVLKDEHELLVAGEHLQDQLDAPDGRVLLIRQPHPEPVPRRCLGPGRRVAARRHAQCLKSLLAERQDLIRHELRVRFVARRDAPGHEQRGVFLRQQVTLAKAEAFMEEMMTGQKVIKVFCHEDETRADFDKVNDEIFFNARNGNRFANILMPLLSNIGNVMYVVVALVGGALLLTDVPNISVSGMAFSISIVVPFLNITRQFAGAVGQVSNQVNMVIMGSAGAHRIFALLDEEPETDDGYVTLVNAKENADGTLTECEERTNVWAWKHPHHDGTLTYTKLQGDVRFYDVNFGYTPEKTVLHNVSLYAKPGQKLAFVGSTGAGKTTITNLINRFYDINDGKIRYDGININKIKKADLRRSLGIVLQDTNLFTGTVMENIRYGNLDACDEECIAAAKLAGADDFIRRLPEGYNTMLFGNGSNLSQGQRQLLAIARAAVADPPVMIMDEATSSIDTRTEAIVQRGMDALMTGRTVFVIAHRLSTVRNSNAIMVLDHGRIIERGTHEDLLKLKGTYYQLYTGALELD